MRYQIILDEHKSILVDDVYGTIVENGLILFVGLSGEIVSLFKTSEIIGFFKEV